MRLATDTGGTFTDLIVEEDDGTITIHKAPTVPSDPPAGVLDALTLAAEARGLPLRQFLARADTFIHGTTHAINAIITGKTAKTALLVTRGHADILTFREGGRANPFDHRIAYPRPFVPRALTFEVDERVLASGEVGVALDERSLLPLVAELRGAGVEAVAVTFLWSTINPAHELQVGAWLERELPGVPYSLSHQVNATLREFRRASATAIDASLKPLMTRYLSGLSGRLESQGFSGQVMVLTSAGGMVGADEAAASPISVINSGPSMAPVAGRHYAKLDSDHRSVIVADTGGTTYDISLVRDGEIPMTRDLWIGQPFVGQLAGYPSVDVKSVGAGGGSLARVDAGGLLRVGPDSAGANPGPACYGRGGQRPTVTDAALVLGYVDATFFLGGSMRLDVDAARTAIIEHVAGPLGANVEAAAWSILELATENMVQAIQEMTVYQGIDASEAVLVGGGGAAGLNSVFIARRLGTPLLIIPETGATMSAAGATIADVAREFSASVRLSTAAFDHGPLAEAIEGLTAQCRAFAQRAGAGTGVIRFAAEARYEGQAWDIDVPLPETGLPGPDELAAFVDRFHEVHEQIFTIRDPDSSVEILGVRARIACSARNGTELRLRGQEASQARDTSRRAYFGEEGWVDTPVLLASSIPADSPRQGPAIIESPFTTIIVDPAARFWKSAHGSLLIEAKP